MHRRNRILIVDDHPTNVAILEEILGDTYHLLTATSGEEALAVAPAFHPDLILLDVMMPGMGGYETCRQLRAHPTLRHTKIIMVSAKAMVSERLHGYEAGADDYITKPFDEDELVAKVRVYLRLKSLEEVEQLKSTILTLLSHETRTPLNGILPPLAMLRAEADMDAEERQMWLEMAYDSATRLQRLFDKVAILSTMHAGQWEVQCSTADLCAIVRSAVGDVTSHAAVRRVTITQELPETAMTALDPPQIRGVVTALLENAIRFSPLDGQVTIRVAHDDDVFRITVRDHGDGIAPDLLPYVFEAFAHTDIAHHTQGQGLSLAIGRHIVLAHNGTIAVESTPGVETTFTVRLPEAACAASGAHPAHPEVQGAR